LNLDNRNAPPFLFLIDKGAKYPEIKNTVGITKMSIMILRIPAKSLVEGSSTSQKEAQMPLLS
jgi:hypothetical protein